MTKVKFVVWIIGALGILMICYATLMPVMIYLSVAVPNNAGGVRVSVLLNGSKLYDETTKNEPQYWMSAPMLFEVRSMHDFKPNKFTITVYDSGGNELTRMDTSIHTIFRKHITIDYVDNMIRSNALFIEKHLHYEVNLM